MHRVYIQYSLRNWSNTWWLTLRGCSISRGLCTYMCFTTQSNFFSSLHYGHHHFLQQTNFEVSTQLKALLGFSQYYSSTYMDRKPCLYYLTLPLCLQLIRSGVVPARKLINQILSPGNFSWGLKSASQYLCRQRSQENHSARREKQRWSQKRICFLGSCAGLLVPGSSSFLKSSYIPAYRYHETATISSS